MSDISVDSPQIIEHVRKPLPWTIFDTKWVPSSTRFVVLGNYARGTGALHVFSLTRGKLNTSLEAEKTSPFKCGTFGQNATGEDRDLATGDFEGRMMVWDLDRTELPVYAVQGHEGIINTIDGVSGFGAPEIVTGGRDGCVRVWDTRQKEKSVAALEPASGEEKRDCWAVAFGNTHNDEERCVVSGFDNGDVKMWDLKTNTLRWETNVRNGVCGIEFDRKGIAMNKLIVTTLEARLRVYDLRTFHPEQGYAQVTQKCSGASTIWCGRHLPQNRDVFMTCGGSGTLQLWKYSYPTSRKRKGGDGNEVGVAGTVVQLAETSLSTQPINSFDWHVNKEGLCVMGAFDQSVRVGIVTRLDRIY